MLTAAAVTGILSVPGGYAFADADVDSLLAGSPSTLADSLPMAVHGPVNVCDDGVSFGDSSRASRDDCLTVGDVLGGGSGRSYGEDPEDEDCDEPAGPDSPEPDAPRSPRPEAPAPERPVVHQARTLPAPAAQLAETGGDPTTVAAGGLGALLLAGGGILYRRGRAVARG